jgi:hypothetical protein
MKRYTTVRNYLLMVNMSYAKGWEESMRLFDDFEKDIRKKKRPMMRVA